jgi:peptide/nickel transport system substrate-binding protein
MSLVTLISITSMITSTMAQPTPQRGPVIDVLRQKVVKSPDAVLIDMIGCQLDFAPDLIRPADIETFDSEGFTITSTPDFHMAHIGFNIRANQSYRRRWDGLLVGKILSDVNFRLATLKCYDQNTIVASIYKYIVTPIRSLVPSAQGGWCNPAVPRIAFNPGDPFTATPGDGTACGTLLAAGYTYDAGANNWRTPAGWGAEGGKLIPEIHCLAPTYEVQPTSAEHCRRWITACNNIGLTSMWLGQIEFSAYLIRVFGYADFDIYMTLWDLGRFPDHIYDMCHSSQDCLLHPWRYNAPGINDPELDALLEVVKFGLDHDAKVIAAHQVQANLYDETKPYAFCYMQLFSRVYFNAFKPGLRGIVNSPGYGAGNSWSYLNMHWLDGHSNMRIEDGKAVVIYQLGEEPELLNPCYAHTMYAWDIINAVVDGLMAVNPYTHEDIPWLADSWEISEPFSTTVTLDSDNRYLEVLAGATVEVTNGMNVTFYLNSTVEWQDGNPFVPTDCEFCLEFLRNNEIPRYASMWEHIVDVQVINATAFKIVSDTASQWLLYDFAGVAALLPPPVWRHLDGQPLDYILAFDPSTNTTMPTGAGPRFGTEWCPTQLYGTGPFVFAFYDPITMYADMPANRYYFKETAEVAALKTEMFHNIGDVDRDGEVWGVDKTRYSLSFGYELGEPEFDVDADITGPLGVPEGKVDAWDGVLISFFFGNKKEYP